MSRRLSTGSGFFRAQPATRSRSEISGVGVSNCTQPDTFLFPAPSPSVVTDIYGNREQDSVAQISRQIVLKTAAYGATPWIPGTVGLYSRPKGAQPSSDWPTKFPVWNVRIDGLKRQQAMFQTADNIL